MGLLAWPSWRRCHRRRRHAKKTCVFARRTCSRDSAHSTSTTVSNRGQREGAADLAVTGMKDMDSPEAMGRFPTGLGDELGALEEEVEIGGSQRGSKGGPERRPEVLDGGGGGERDDDGAPVVGAHPDGYSLPLRHCRRHRRCRGRGREPCRGRKPEPDLLRGLKRRRQIVSLHRNQLRCCLTPPLRLLGGRERRRHRRHRRSCCPGPPPPLAPPTPIL
uniref:DUF834 domain-containing protein n=1 Tax=Oryza brachyantha TaxID=4533 RepID=J3L8W1_ORYBR